MKNRTLRDSDETGSISDEEYDSDGYYNKTGIAHSRKGAIRKFLEAYKDDPDYDKIHIVRAFMRYDHPYRILTYNPTGEAVYMVIYRLDDLDR